MEPKTKKTPSTQQASSFFLSPFLEFCFATHLSFCFLASRVGPCIWHFESSSALLWNATYSQKGDLSSPLASSESFSHVMLVFFLMLQKISRIWTYKNSWPHWSSTWRLQFSHCKFFHCKGISKCLGGLFSSNTTHFPYAPKCIIQWPCYFWSVLLNFSVCKFGHAKSLVQAVLESLLLQWQACPQDNPPVPSPAGFKCLMIFRASFASSSLQIRQLQ